MSSPYKTNYKEVVGPYSQDQTRDVYHILSEISEKLMLINREKDEENFMEYRDTLLEVPLSPFEMLTNNSSESHINILIRKWIGTLFDKLAKASFSGYFKGKLLEKELKVFFSRNLINNFINLMKHLKDLQDGGVIRGCISNVIKICQLHSKSALQFLMSKYPQKSKVQPDIYLQQMIPQIKQSQFRPTDDVLAASGFMFQFSSNGQYDSQIKKFLKIIIQETKSKRGKFIAAIKKNFQIRNQESQKIQQVENQVGSKISENASVFTDQQIKSPGVEIKSSEILRIIIKWIGYLYEDIERSKSKIGERTTGFLRKNKPLSSKQIINEKYNIDFGLSTKQKIQISTFIESQFKQKVPKIELDQNQKLNSLLISLTKFISQSRQMFEYIDLVQFQTSLFSHIVSQSVSNLAVSLLSKLIHILLKVINTTGKTDQNLKDICLLRFGVMDLFRAKCSGTRDQILKVYQNFKKQQSEFEIIRVKNRLKTGNKDFLINLRYKQSFLICELQLYVNTSGDYDKKQSDLQHFSHFLYQLQRSRFGVISEAAIVCSNLYNPVSYFKKTLTELSNKEPFQNKKIDGLVPKYSKGTFKSEGYINNKNTYSFICTSCFRYFNAYSSFLDVLTNEKTKQNICGECVIAILGQQKAPQCILGDKIGQYFKRINPDYKFYQQDYLLVVKKAIPDRFLALRYYSGSEFFYPVFSDHYENKFYEKIEFERLTKNSYVFILDKNNLKQLPPIKMQSLKSQIIKQSIPISFILGDKTDKITNSVDLQQKYIPILPINQKAASVKSDETIICYSYQQSSVLIIDSNGVKNPEDSYLQTKRKKVLYWHASSKVDTWVVENLQLTLAQFKLFLDQNSGTVLRVIKFENNLFDSFNIELKDLKQLKLRGNKFQKIDFSQLMLNSLQVLDLSKNQITQIINSKSNSVPNLKYLNLCQNKLKTFVFEKDAFPSLTKLYLSNNPLKSIKAEINSVLSNLRTLQMKNTNIKKINFTAAQFPKLEILILSNNSLLESLDLPPLQKIHQVDLSNSPNFSNLRFGTFSVRFLRILKLNKCNLTKPISHHQFPDLQKLYISENGLTELDLSRSDMKSLKELNASNNKIRNIEFSKYFKQIQKIELQKNCIQVFDIQNIKFKNLIEINLEQNQLVKFKISPLQTLKILRLSYNPCKIQDLLKLNSQKFLSLSFLSLGINPNTKSFLEWTYSILDDDSKQNYKKNLRLKAQRQSIQQKIKKLEKRQLPNQFKQLKFFLQVLKNTDLPFRQYLQSQQEIRSYCQSLFQSIQTESDFTRINIYSKNPDIALQLYNPFMGTQVDRRGYQSPYYYNRHPYQAPIFNKNPSLQYIKQQTIENYSPPANTNYMHSVAPTLSPYQPAIYSFQNNPNNHQQYNVIPSTWNKPVVQNYPKSSYEQVPSKSPFVKKYSMDTPFYSNKNGVSKQTNQSNQVYSRQQTYNPLTSISPQNNESYLSYQPFQNVERISRDNLATFNTGGTSFFPVNHFGSSQINVSPRVQQSQKTNFSVSQKLPPVFSHEEAQYLYNISFKSGKFASPKEVNNTRT